MDQVVKRMPGSAPAPVKIVEKKSTRKLFVIGAIVFVVLGLTIGGAFGFNQMMAKKNFATEIDKNKYQAVFLTNGQVYFGKIDTLNTLGYKLKDIYYLQVQNGVQPDTTKAAASKTPDNKDQSLSLAKLGSELHGPEDTMYIESKQVLFWENLKDDSQVVKAIKQNQNK